MVSYKDIQASNALIDDTTAPRVAVFVGGTSGIGMYTIRALVGTGTTVRIYLVGRPSSSERMRAFVRELHAINPKAEVVWTEGEIAFLAETKRVCEAVKRKESRVDLLFLSAGYAPFSPRTETAEGVEVVQSLEYYSRMLFVLHLLPLLREAEAPRVVSVLGGGMERVGGIDLHDLDLKKPGSFGPVKAQTQFIAMNTIGLDRLATDNPGVTFIHSWPGWVDTGNMRRGGDPNSLTGWALRLVVEPLVRGFGYSHDESGQRHLFQCTSAAFGGRGVPWKGKQGVNTVGKPTEGLFLVNYKCACTPNSKVVSLLRERAQGRVWEHTLEVLGQYL